MRRILALFIGVAFLGYGLLRLIVGSAMLGHEFGYIDIEAFHEPLDDVGRFLEDKADRQFIPTSVVGYLAYLALMGLTLASGAIGSLTDRAFGLPLIAAFLLMYAALFVNFQTINPKIIHLAIASILFLVLLWSKRRPRA